MKSKYYSLSPSYRNQFVNLIGNLDNRGLEQLKEILDDEMRARNIIGHQRLCEINKQIERYTYNFYFISRGVPFDRIVTMCKEKGIVFACEPTLYENTLDDCRLTFDIVNADSMLVFAWHSMKSGRFEITAYLS